MYMYLYQSLFYTSYRLLIMFLCTRTGILGEYTFLKCVHERVSHDKCKCSRQPPQYYISREEDSNSQRKYPSFAVSLRNGK